LLVALAMGCASPSPERIRALEQRIDADLDAVHALEMHLGPEAERPPLRVRQPGARHYQTQSMRLRPLAAWQREGLQRILVDALHQAGVTELVDAADPSRRVYPPDGPFDGLPTPMLYAATAVVGGPNRGAEIDLIVPLREGAPWRVSVLFEPAGRLLVAGRAAHEGTDVAALPPGRLAERYGIGRVQGWSADERRSLERALSLLEDRERSRLAALDFVRLPGSGGSGPQGQACGYYRMEAATRRIEVFDCAFAFDAHHFAGTPERPERASTRMLLHEIGHAIALAPVAELAARLVEQRRRIESSRRAFNRLLRRARAENRPRLRPLRDRLDELFRRHHELRARAEREMREPRTALAFARLPGAEAGITPYGRDGPQESFAEAFALYHADRSALARISPELVSFFASGRHLD
jgi:hypothetical protein